MLYLTGENLAKNPDFSGSLSLVLEWKITKTHGIIYPMGYFFCKKFDQGEIKWQQ